MRARYLPPVILGLLFVAAVEIAAAPKPTTRDICVADFPFGTTPLNTFVFQDVGVLAVGRAIPLQGIFFTTARKPAPFHGSAMMAADGSVRLGIFVHSSAESVNDFTLSGVTDTSFTGTLRFDSDGDYRPEGTLTLELVSCAAVSIP